MKRTIISLALSACMALITLPSNGQQPDKKAEKARGDLKEAQKNEVVAKQDLKNAKKDSVSEYQKFKKDAEAKISDNDKKIAEFKVNVAKQKKEIKAKNEKKLAAMEEKNNNLKAKLAAYKKDEAKDKWTSFKNAFNHDMDELGKALKDFTSKM